MGYSLFLATMTNAAVNVHVQGLAWTWVFLLPGKQLDVGELGRVLTPCWQACGLKSLVNMHVDLTRPLSNTRGCILLAGFQNRLVPWVGRGYT